MSDKRWPIIDLLRFFSFLAIIIFHMSYTLWSPAGYDRVPEPGPWADSLEAFARALSFSGFTVMFLSFFLFGVKQEMRRGWLKLWFILLVFFVIWAGASGEFPYIWDIYPFLLAAIALVGLLRGLPGWLLAAIGAITVSIPFWYFEPQFNWPDWLRGAVFGNCSISDRVGEDWPLLPWVGYPLFALGLGKLARDYSERLRKISWLEGSVWILLLGLSLVRIGEYYPTPLGNRFACFIFRRPVETFWAYQVWVIFLVRLGWLPAVDLWLQRRALVAWITRRPVNQRFILAYFLHYPYCLAWAAVAAHFQMNLRSWIFVAGVFSCVLWVELSTTIIRRYLR